MLIQWLSVVSIVRALGTIPDGGGVVEVRRVGTSSSLDCWWSFVSDLIGATLPLRVGKVKPPDKTPSISNPQVATLSSSYRTIPEAWASAKLVWFPGTLYSQRVTPSPSIGPVITIIIGITYGKLPGPALFEILLYM